MDLNRVIVAGRLTGDPEMKTLSTGSNLASFNVAINRRWKDESGEMREEVCFIPVKCFGARASTIGKFFKKGSQILVEGRLRQESWETDGVKKSRHVIMLESFSFVDKATPSAPKDVPEGAEMVPGDEEVPF